MSLKAVLFGVKWCFGNGITQVIIEPHSQVSVKRERKEFECGR